jgi:2-oxo-4-hydroxy-4-carboxy-5-ureidoimidazoline decarboxylase
MANGIQWFNALSWSEASQTLSQVCPAPAFVTGMMQTRPAYRTADELLEHANRVLAGLPEDELGVALSGYPSTASEALEQWTNQLAASDLRIQLAKAAAAYQAKFGTTFVAHSDDRSDAELLALLLDRLDNSIETEREIARAELGIVTKNRLERLLTVNGGE